MSSTPAPASTRPASQGSGLVSTLGFLHQSTAVLAAAGLVAFIWFWHPAQQRPDTVEAAANHMFVVGLIALAYLAIQSLGTLTQSRQTGWRVLFDFLVSSLPLLVLVYAGIDWARGSLQLNPFQKMTMALMGFAVVVDVLIYSLVANRILRRATAD